MHVKRCDQFYSILLLFKMIDLNILYITFITSIYAAFSKSWIVFMAQNRHVLTGQQVISKQDLTRGEKYTQHCYHIYIYFFIASTLPQLSYLFIVLLVSNFSLAIASGPTAPGLNT